MEFGIQHLALMVGVTWLVLDGATGYPMGAPAAVCTNGLIPGHGTKEYRVSPFKVTASSKQYTAKKPIAVSIESLNSETFKGFLVQAQDEYGNVLNHGKWLGDYSKSIDKCGAVTHSNRDEKRIINLSWYPLRGRGNVTFVATIVPNLKKFYHNIKADVESTAASATVMKDKHPRQQSIFPQTSSDFATTEGEVDSDVFELDAENEGLVWPHPPWTVPISHPLSPLKGHPQKAVQVHSPSFRENEESRQDPFADHSEHFSHFPTHPLRFRPQTFRHAEPEEPVSDFSVVRSHFQAPSASGQTTFFFPSNIQKRPVFQQFRQWN